MKIAIIGGGIAGLSAAISLRNAGIDAMIYEKVRSRSNDGLGLILLANGLEALGKIGLRDEMMMRGCKLENAVVGDQEGTILCQEILSDCLGVSRKDVIRILAANLGRQFVKTGMKFLRFGYDRSGKAVKVIFENGKEAEADHFIAADGTYSAVRESLFHSAGDYRCPVLEMVGIVRNRDIRSRIGSSFFKTLDKERGLAFGILPCNGKDMVWYIQLDRQNYPLWDTSASGLRKAALRFLEGWPWPAPEVLASSDFSAVHLWESKDMEPPPSFYHQNVLLIGDAAHTLLNFTSQGANTALEDAALLPSVYNKVLSAAEQCQQLESFARSRREAIQKYVVHGRSLEAEFLHGKKSAASVNLPFSFSSST